jgi:hypothetical protein
VETQNSFPSLPQEVKTASGLLAEVFYWYDNGNISGGNKTEYTKDANGNVTLEKRYSWNTQTQAWEEQLRVKIEYAYNAQGLLAAATYSDWNYETSAWEPADYDSYTVTYIFDGNNNVSNFTQQGVADGQYMRKVDYSDYDSQKRALAAVEYHGEPYYDQENQETVWKWVKSYSSERAFDGYGNLILDDFCGYYGSGEILSYRYKYEYAYDAAGRQTMHSYIHSDGDGNVDGYKSEYACDANGNEILYVEYTYDSAAQTFIPEYKSEYTYGDRIVPGMFDSDYIPLTVKYSDWDIESGAWAVEMEGKYEWQFDANNNPSTMTMSTKTGNEWIWYGTMTYYYTRHEVSGIAGAPSNSRRTWISGGRLHLENGMAGTVQVFDISGRQRLNAYSSGSQSLDVSHLPQGIYLVRVNGKTFKIIRN